MAFEVTEKAVRKNYDYCIKVPYCELQTLLRYEQPVAYTYGVYGWKSDIYQTDWNRAISTGYSPVGNVTPDIDLIRRYEQYAKSVVNAKLDYLTTKEKLKMLAFDFTIEAVTEANVISIQL